MKVTLQFCRFSSLWGRLIPYFTQGKVGHVDIVLPSGELLGAQYDAGLGGPDIPAGVQIRPAGYGKACGMTNPVRVSLDATPEQADAFYKFLNDQLDKPYDTIGILAFIFSRNWRDDGAWFCSELGAAALETAGIVRPLATPTNKITPAGLLLVCSAFAPVCPKS